MSLIFPEKPAYHNLRFTTPCVSHIFQVNQYENTLSGAHNLQTNSLVALVGQRWDELFSELKLWQAFGTEVKRSYLTHNRQAETISM